MNCAPGALVSNSFVDQVVGVEREIVLHHRSREYLAQMRKFFQAQVARDRIQVRESVFEYAHDVHTVLLLRALG